MNENNETQKICSSCNNVNKGTNTYCRFCGASLEGIEATKLEAAGVSDLSESNKVEIIKDYTLRKYGSICCVILVPFVILGFMILGLFIHPLFFFAFLFIFIVMFPCFICAIIGTLRMKSSYGRTREFSISDQGIKIMLPRKFTFQINWSQFDTIHAFDSVGSDYGALWPTISTSYYNCYFFSKNTQVTNFILETDVDFSSKDVSRIATLINQYALRLNKDYIWDKKSAKKKIKEASKVTSPSIPAIQAIPKGSNQLPISQSQQIDASLVCPYCGNTGAKKYVFSWGGAIFGSICILIILWIIIYTFVPPRFTFISLVGVISICIVMGIIGAIKRFDRVICPQCKKQFSVKRKKPNL
ncbi:MAG: hypothetical protein ACFFDK_04920 [Promethearchaeota archaeon]